MADKDLQDRIIRFLNGKSKKGENISKIVHALRVPKKSVNKQLYRLEKEGRVVKVVESPPQWALSEGDASQGAARTARARRRSGSMEQSDEGDEDLERKILTYLQSKQKPAKSLEIAKGTGHSRTAEINSTLYSMQDKGLIQKSTGKTPTWTLASIGAAKEGSPSDYVQPATSSSSSQGEGSSSRQGQGCSSSYQGQDQIPYKDGIPVFQSTELFKTDLSFDSDTNDLYADDISSANENFGQETDNYDTEMKSQDSYGKVDDSFDNDSGPKADPNLAASVEESNSELGQDFDRSDPPVDINQVSGIMVNDGESDSNIADGMSNKSPVFEEIGDVSNEQGIDENGEEGNQEQMDDRETDSRFSENMTGDQLFHEKPYTERTDVKKAKTFRDVFRLDDPMSDNSNSFSSSGDLDNVCKTENESDSDSENLFKGKDSQVKDCFSDKVKLELLDSSVHRDSSPVVRAGVNVIGRVTPEVLMWNKVKTTPDSTGASKVWNTPQLIEEVSVMEDTIKTEENCEDNESSAFRIEIDYNNMKQDQDGNRDQYEDEDLAENLQEHDKYNRGEQELGKNGEGEVSNDIDENSQDDEQCFGDDNEEAEEDDGNAAGDNVDDMEDCDKVLEVLADLKASAQFVIKKRTDIPPENLDAVLEKCLELNYISGSSKFWKITDEGMEYISKKTGKSASEPLMFEAPQNPKISKHKGPPPSPMALLNKKGDGQGLGKKVPSNEIKGILKNSSEKPKIKGILKNSSQKHVSNNANAWFKVPEPAASSLGFSSNSVLNNSTKSVPLLNQHQSGPVPLMSLKFDSMSSVETSFESTQNPGIPVDKRSSNYMQKEQSSNSVLWGTGSNPSLYGSEAPIKQAPGSSLTSGPFFSMPESLQKNSSLSSSSSLRQKSPQNARKSLNEAPKVDIPDKYADYPNQSTTAELLQKKPKPKGSSILSQYQNYPNQGTSLQSLKSRPRTSSLDRPGAVGQSKSAFNKGPPPSPMDILSKNLKKTEISPPGSYQTDPAVSQPSSSFTTTQTASSRRSGPFGSPIDSSRLSQTGSQNFSSLLPGKQAVTVNQSSFTQSGPLFGNQNKQTASQSFRSFSAGNLGQLTNQSSQSSVARPVTGGPPPPPAVKLGLQSANTDMSRSIPKPVQNVSMPNLSLALNTESFNALNKNPVSALMEYAQSRKLVATVEVLSRRGASHRPTFEMAAFVGERKFPSVTCSNKKDGRKEACDIAMRQLIAEGQFQADSASSAPPVPLATMTHFDTIAALTHRGFTALVSQITAESFAGRKVIAGLVMKRSAEDTGILISLGTGNRCITGQQLSLQGNTVNDSHAEIITRRGFLRFLYKRLMEYDPNKPNPMFQRAPSGKLQIRPNITFHLYISTAPCGDGALFSPRDAESSKAPVDNRVRPPHEPTFSSNVQGLLRTKVEGGEGTIPIEAGFKEQTFDGIQRGERLRTMSCTDKICRWNVVGLQGALLSHFLEPVYLDSLTLGLLYDYGHLCRAVCCRVGQGTPDVDTELPPNFHLNHPWLGRVTVCDPPREVQKTKALSVNWSFGDKAPEVTDGTLGLCYTSIEKGFFSRCSKRNLFMNFKELCEKFGRQDLLQVPSYNAAKMAASEFVAAKEVMLKRFKDNGFGKWVSKPVEEEMFGFEEQA